MAGETIDITVLLHDKVTRGISAIQAGFGAMGGVLRNVGGVLTSFQAQLAALGVTLAGGAFAQKTISTFAEFDDTVRAAGAVMRATKEDMVAITDSAKLMGMTTRYSASQAAEGLKNLGMAGLNATQATAALPNVLNLAAAGGLDLGTAADICTNVMSGFNLEVKDLAQINDVLAHTFTSTNSSLTELGEAFKMVGPISAAMGGDFEELVTMLGKLHDNGMKGTMAGTSLRGALAALMNPVGDTEKTLAKLNDRIGGTGIQIKDANGNFIGFVEIVRQLEAAGMTGAEALRIFGTEAGPGMAALVNIGSEALEKQVAAAKNVAGTTSRISKEMEGGLGGALRALNSAYESILISVGEAFGDDIVALVKRLTEYFINLIAEIEGLKQDGTLERWKNLAVDSIKPVIWLVGEVAAAFRILGKTIAGLGLIMTGNFRAGWDLLNDMLRDELGLTKELAQEAFNEINKAGEESAKTVFHKIDQNYGTVVQSIKEKTNELGKLVGHADVAGLKAAEVAAGIEQKAIGVRTKAEAPVAEAAPKVSMEVIARTYADRVKADLAVEMTAIDIMYEQGKKTIAEFYAEKERLIRRSIDNELQLLQKQFSSEQDVDKRAALDAQIYSKKKELEEQLLQLTADRVRDEIQLEKDKLAEIEKQNQQQLAMTRVFSDIKARVEAGSAGQFEAQFQKEIFELQERHQREHQVLVDAKATDAEFMELARQQELERMQVHEEQARRVMTFRLETASTIAGGMSQLFDEMYQAGDQKNKALFYASKAAAIAEATIKIAQAVVGALGSPPYGVAAMGTAAVIAAMGGVQLAKIMSTGLAEGGRVPGHSPHSKADNIVARLTADEFVQPVAAVKYYGLPFMEAIRTLSLPRESVFDLNNIKIPRDPGNFRYAYAEGGSVKGAPEAPAAGAAQQNFDIVNVVDQSVFDQYLGSTTGKKALMNIIRSNAYELKNAMAAEM